MNGTLKATLQVFWLIGAVLTYIVLVVERWQEAGGIAANLAMNFTVDIVLALTWPLVVAARLAGSF